MFTYEVIGAHVYIDLVSISHMMIGYATRQEKNTTIIIHLQMSFEEFTNRSIYNI